MVAGAKFWRCLFGIWTHCMALKDSGSYSFYSSQMCMISVSASVCLNVSLSLLHTQSQVLSTLWEWI